MTHSSHPYHWPHVSGTPGLGILSRPSAAPQMAGATRHRPPYVPH
ncbi:hypothetical protein [uncultured Corynebacterium sp.]|nr:hypothetical protein [uncultured Corynebacterium sp.]